MRVVSAKGVLLSGLLEPPGMAAEAAELGLCGLTRMQVRGVERAWRLHSLGYGRRATAQPRISTLLQHVVYLFLFLVMCAIKAAPDPRSPIALADICVHAAPFSSEGMGPVRRVCLSR